MVKLISYPFRLNVLGSVVTQDEGEEYYGDELAMLLKTVPGERELVPEYGIEDPTFGEFSYYELIEKISLFGPPVDIVNCVSNFTTDGRVAVQVDFEAAETVSEEDQFNEDYTDEDYNTNDEDDEIEDPAYGFTDATDVLDGI